MIKRRYVTHPPFLLGTYTAGSGHQDYYLPAYYDEGVCTTHGNYRWQNPVGVCGGTFLMARTEHNYGMTGLSMTDGPSFSYHGMITASTQSLGLPTVIPTGLDWMVDAYARMKPTKPTFDFFNAAAELREVPDSIPSAPARPRTRADRSRPRTPDDALDIIKRIKEDFVRGDFRNFSNGYAAITLGWLPLYNDISNFVEATRKIDKRVQQLIRDNGKKVRRRRVMLNDESSTTTNIAGYNLLHPVLPVGWYGSQPVGTETTSVTDRVWSVASFRYWLPNAPRGVDFGDYIKARAYGMNIRPSVVYNAIPWTFVVDYFSNLGTLVSNLDPGVADSLAADYFYVMRETEVTRTRSVTCNMWGTNAYDNNIQCTSTSKLNTKSRLLGSPFGNGLQIDSDLSAKQWSILGALGVSRWN